MSTLNKQPTQSSAGASNFSFDKEQVLKHVLIVHLSFLAYKCDTCAQFYAFDEPQTKQHAALVHQCGTGQLGIAGQTGSTDSTPAQPQTCHFKLIKTEEEINLAINKAQQFINKLPASTAQSKSIKGSGGDGQKVSKATGAASLANVTIEAAPKYKCCRCVQTPAPVGSPAFQPIVLYTYQDALDHVMQVHMSGGSASAAGGVQSKKDKKLNYELELFEQNLEDLLASETGQTTTITVGSSVTKSNVNPQLGTDLDDCYSDDDLDGGDFGYDDSFTDDLSEWNVILNEPFNMHQANVLTNTLSNTTNQSPSTLAANRKQKRFKTNNNTSITTSATSPSSLSDTENNSGNTSLVKANANSSASSVVAKQQPQQMSRRFYFKPHLVYKCQLCTRKFHQFDYNHWLQHDLEHHHALYKSQEQQFTCFKCTSSCSAGTAQKVFANFTQFLEHYKQEHLNATQQQQQAVAASTEVALADGTLPVASTEADQKLINCLVCGAELKCTYVDMLKHFQSEHELNLFDLKLNLTDLELIHTLQIHNQVHLSQSVRLRRRCFIRIPPQVINPSVPSEQALTKSDLIDKELKLLNEIYKEQIIEKQIVSWLNSEQFLRRNFNYNSYVCIICNATKSQILETHYHANKAQSASQAAAVAGNAPGALVPAGETSTSSRHQFYSDEMKTVVLTNHILSHFNEYCYRCMSCKISWPDRTQLLKHAQECSNSQVVRTKTKYKLKANCRLQLKFYLQTYLDYWQYEKCLESKSVEQLNSLNNTSLVPTVAPPSTKLLDCKVFLSDIVQNKDLLLSASNRCNLNAICLMDGQKLLVKDDEEEEEEQQAEKMDEKAEEFVDAVETVEAVEAKVDDVNDEIKAEGEKSELANANAEVDVVEKAEETTDVVMKDEAEQVNAVQPDTAAETTMEVKQEEEKKEETVTAEQPATGDEVSATVTKEEPQPEAQTTTMEQEVK